MGLPMSDTVLALTVLLGLGVFASTLARRLPIPYTVLLVICGMALRAIADSMPVLEPFSGFRLTPDVVLFLFLPTLIFETGLALDSRRLLRNLAPVLMLAVPALLISTAVIGFGLWWLIGLNLALALLFGALISATDPVAVVALFKELGTPERLTVLVEGESLLNDATAIVVFKLLLGLALAGSLADVGLGAATGEFLQVFLGGALFGLVWGAFNGWIAGRLHLNISSLLMMTVAMAYAGFILAEHVLHLSGVMATVGTAIAFGAYALPRLSKEDSATVHETWSFVALACNTLLFVLVGLSVDFPSLVEHADVILLAVLLVMLARLASVYGLLPLTLQIFRLPRVSMAERHIMWWGGLKGGLAIAMVLSIPPILEGAEFLRYLTLGVVLFSLLFNATTIRPLLEWLGIDRLTGQEQAELRRSTIRAGQRAQAVMMRFSSAGLVAESATHAARNQVYKVLDPERSTLSAELKFRQTELEAYKVELDTLKELLRSQVIQPHVYYGLRGELRRARDRVVAGEDLSALPLLGRRGANPLLKMERGWLRHLRERDWAARPLSHYLGLRVSRHLLEDIARLLMAQSVMSWLNEGKGIQNARVTHLEAHYRSRIDALYQRLAAIRDSHPEFFRGFEKRLSTRAALVEAQNEVDAEHNSGFLGTKPWALLTRRIEKALAQVPSVGYGLPALSAKELIDRVPLLKGLPPQAMEQLHAKLQAMSFLNDDVVVAEGEHGDAMYLVVRGFLKVTQRRRPGEPDVSLSHLGPGDFFGEIALLEDHVRTATVTSDGPSTLMRLSRRDFMAYLDINPEIARQVESARKERRKGGKE